MSQVRVQKAGFEFDEKEESGLLKTLRQATDN